MSIPASKHLERLEAAVRGHSDDVDSLVEGLSEAELLWRPAPDRWGIADCLEHLIATGEAYHPRIRRALADAPRSGASGVYRPRLFGRWFIRLSGPDARFRIRARGPFVPPPARPDAPERFERQQVELLQLIDASSGADLQRTRVSSPLSRFLRLTLGECLEMLVAHQRRHLDQAWRVRRAAGEAS